MKNFILHSKSYKTYDGALKATEKAVVKFPWLLDQCVRFVVVATPEGRFQPVVWDAGPLSYMEIAHTLGFGVVHGTFNYHG